MKRIRNVTLALMAITAVVAYAADGFKLRRTAKAGDEITMRLTADIEIPGIQATFSAKVKEKVLKVDANGDYTIEATQSEGKVFSNGTEVDNPAGNAPTSTSTKYSASGAVLEITGANVSESSFRMAAMSAFLFEDKQYNVGDKIAYENKPNKLNGNVGSKVSIEVAGTEKIGSIDTVKIVFSFKELTGEAPAENFGTAWVDQKDGALVKVNGEYKNAPIPDVPFPVNAKIKLERI